MVGSVGAPLSCTGAFLHRVYLDSPTLPPATGSSLRKGPAIAAAHLTETVRGWKDGGQIQGRTNHFLPVVPLSVLSSNQH